MPGRNIVKEYAQDGYYHVYSRGSNKEPIFTCENDYYIFISLLKRYLSDKPAISPSRTTYPWYHQNVTLLAYCLMPNHIHLFIRQNKSDSMAKFMRSLMTSYSMYFNKSHNHIGPVFQSRYRAVLVDKEAYYQHISRYIHMNPSKWLNYEHSSLKYYQTNEPSPAWLDTEEILSQFNNKPEEYIEFLSSYSESKSEIEELKWYLADNLE